ncbi:MAG: hypothetical protein ABWY57_15935 [Mycetocola sp.]
MTAPTVMACKCGTIMTPIHDGADIKHCLNCDRVQDRECGEDARRRVTTTEDRRFHLAWEQLKRTYYGDA